MAKNAVFETGQRVTSYPFFRIFWILKSTSNSDSYFGIGSHQICPDRFVQPSTELKDIRPILKKANRAIGCRSEDHYDYCGIMGLYRILWILQILWQRLASPLLSPFYSSYILWCPFVLPGEIAECQRRPLVSTPNGAIVLSMEIFHKISSTFIRLRNISSASR